jgi:hypothetical protein
VFGPQARRILHTPRDLGSTRQILRSRLRPFLADVPGGWFGRELSPGVSGVLLGKRIMLVPVPPGRTLYTSWRPPTIGGRLLARADGGCDLRLSVYTPGFPYRVIEDPVAMQFLDEWLAATARELGASVE